MMKLTIDAAALRDALGHSVARTGVHELQHLALLEATGVAPMGQVSLTTMDFVQQVTTRTEAQVEEGGELAVDPKLLKSALLGLEGEVKITQDETGLQVSQGRCRSRIETVVGDPLKAFPLFDEEQAQPLPSMAAMWYAAIERVAYAAAKSDVRHYLNAVFIGRQQAIALSGHRGASTPLPSVPDDIELLIPEATVQRLLKALEGEKRVVLEVFRRGKDTPHALRMRSEGLDLTVKLVDGRYPNESTVIPKPKDVTAKATFSAPEARIAFERAAALDAKGVRIQSGDGVLRIAGEHTDDLVECAGGAQAFEVGINPAYVLDVIKAAGDDDVTWNFTAVDGRQLFTLGGREGEIHIIMPLR